MVALALALLIAFPNTSATLMLDAGWTASEAPTIVAAYKGPSGAVLAVTRVQVPNADAWRAKTRDAYVTEIERGALAAVRGGVRISHRTSDANGVPVLDLELRREDGATLVVRYLLFRTYVLALAIELPKGVDARPARTIAASFVPPPSS